MSSLPFLPLTIKYRWSTVRIVGEEVAVKGFRCRARNKAMPDFIREINLRLTETTVEIIRMGLFRSVRFDRLCYLRQLAGFKAFKRDASLLRRETRRLMSRLTLFAVGRSYAGLLDRPFISLQFHISNFQTWTLHIQGLMITGCS